MPKKSSKSAKSTRSRPPRSRKPADEDEVIEQPDDEELVEDVEPDDESQQEDDEMLQDDEEDEVSEEAVPYDPMPLRGKKPVAVSGNSLLGTVYQDGLTYDGRKKEDVQAFAKLVEDEKISKDDLQRLADAGVLKGFGTKAPSKDE